MANAASLSEDIDYALELVRGRWRLLIVRELLAGPQRPGSLARALRTVAKNRLHQNLRDLEKLGLVRRTQFDGRVPKVEYSLTPLGSSLRPVIDSLTAWGAENGRLLNGRGE